ncbi:MAG: hypothetical protein M3Q30_20930, partial [Actinomycetota bacterium]|nr:hypothetical protein [Actinomycetota bacterium]
RWDPSHPEGHVDLLLARPNDVRRVRAWVIRLAKAWNHAFSEPALCSFNLAALALEAITKAESLDLALLRFFEHAVTALARGLTADPAGVSAPIRLPFDKDRAVARLTTAGNKLSDALTVDDDPDKVAPILASLFPEQLTAAEATRVAWAAALREQTKRVGVGVATPLATAAAAIAPLKHTRSFGE